MILQSIHCSEKFQIKLQRFIRIITVVNHGFVNWIGGFIREDTSGEAGNNFLDVEFLGQRKHVVVDGHVDAEKFEVGPHIPVETADFGRQMEHVGGLMLLKDLNGQYYLINIFWSI